jgi:hypothetical protein
MYQRDNKICTPLCRPSLQQVLAKGTLRFVPFVILFSFYTLMSLTPILNVLPKKQVDLTCVLFIRVANSRKYRIRKRQNVANNTLLIVTELTHNVTAEHSL